MSTIKVCDLSHSTELTEQGMGEIRGGFKFAPNVNLNLNVNQQLIQVQDIDLNVLNNNGSIGAGFVGPHIDLDARLKAENKVILPKFA
jgi:hypothetical protein